MRRANHQKIGSSTIVIFGSTGDLSKRKLIPALFDLHAKEAIPDFKIVGFSHTPKSDDDFRQFMKEAIVKKKSKYPAKVIKNFLNKGFYREGDFNNLGDYTNLVQTLKELDNKTGQCTNKILYLAVSPKYYEVILKNLAKSRLSHLCAPGWTRILIEKPFGKDIKTAYKLDKLLAKLFKEEQVFRIDHYLAKGTIQNILTFRFSNAIFEPLWNNKYVEKIEIKLLEKLDVGTRGDFYDAIGALRDVGQNHILQILALIAMERPKDISAKAIRKERAKIIEALETPSKENIAASVMRGQYVGYKQTEGVSLRSKTETYFKIKANINNDRWRGVPIYLEAGKAMAKKKVEAAVYFKRVKDCFCPPEHAAHKHRNKISFIIEPGEKIVVRFWTKLPGLGYNVKKNDFSFDYRKDKKTIVDAYERVLFNSMTGDQAIFASSAELEASWKFITAILDNWGNTELHQYKKGSNNIRLVKF